VWLLVEMPRNPDPWRFLHYTTIFSALHNHIGPPSFRRADLLNNRFYVLTSLRDSWCRTDVTATRLW
jgi:hypothetical protein